MGLAACAGDSRTDRMQGTHSAEMAVFAIACTANHLVLSLFAGSVASDDGYDARTCIAYMHTRHAKWSCIVSVCACVVYVSYVSFPTKKWAFPYNAAFMSTFRYVNIPPPEPKSELRKKDKQASKANPSSLCTHRYTHMLAILLTSLSLQHHAWFNVKDVRHRLPAPSPNVTLVYGDLKGFVGSVKRLESPKYAVLASNGLGTHCFLHDKRRIRCIYWSGKPTSLQKIQITIEMMQWLLLMAVSIDHRVLDYEDGMILSIAQKCVSYDALCNKDDSYAVAYEGGASSAILDDGD